LASETGLFSTRRFTFFAGAREYLLRQRLSLSLNPTASTLRLQLSLYIGTRLEAATLSWVGVRPPAVSLPILKNVRLQDAVVDR